MTERDDDLVDAFLADLGAVQAPGHLAAGVMRAVRDERPRRASRAPAWLAAAAVLATAVVVLTAFAWIGAGPSPSPSSAPSVPAASASAEPASPSASPTATPSAPPAVLGTWDIMLTMPDLKQPVVVTVVDHAGTLTGVAQAGVLPPDAGGPHDLSIGVGRDARSITVGWIGGACDAVARLELAPDGHTLSLRFPPRPACDSIGIGFAVELRFKDPVDPAGFSGTWSEDMVAPSDVNPQVVAFADTRLGFVGGRTWGTDVAVILETADGGRTWRVEGLGGIGDVSAIGATATGRAWAGYSCAEDMPGCRSGFYRYDAGLWGRVDDAWPVSLSFAGDVGAGLFRTAGGPTNDAGIPIPEVRLMNPGEVWSAVENPCPTTMVTQDVSRADASTVEVLCESEGATGNSKKELQRSTDGGLSWTRFADGPYVGTGMHMDLLADGTGWMWGNRSSLLATADAGATWTPLDIVDGDVRMVSGADALGGGAGVVLVRDSDREQILLLRTDDGRMWAELSSFPIICCGG